MNCTTCNTPRAGYELRHGLCLDCLGRRCTEQLNEIQRLNVELRESRNERHLWERDRARYDYIKRLNRDDFGAIKWASAMDGRPVSAIVDELIVREKANPQ